VRILLERGGQTPVKWIIRLNPVISQFESEVRRIQNG
jgi:hypothetical protein